MTVGLEITELYIWDHASVLDIIGKYKVRNLVTSRYQTCQRSVQFIKYFSRTDHYEITKLD